MQDTYSRARALKEQEKYGAVQIVSEVVGGILCKLKWGFGCKKSYSLCSSSLISFVALVPPRKISAKEYCILLDEGQGIQEHSKPANTSIGEKLMYI